jgi:hypothetical protein
MHEGEAGLCSKQIWMGMRLKAYVPGCEAKMTRYMYTQMQLRTGAAPEGARYALLCPALLMLLQWVLLLVAWSDSTMMAVCC